MTTPPINGPTIGPVPSTGKRTDVGPGAVAAAKVAAKLPLDHSLAKVAHGLAPGHVNLDAIRVPVGDASDLVSTAMEADRMRNHGGAGLGKAGMAMAALNIFLDVRAIVSALGQHPIAVDRAIAGFVGIGVNLGEFVEKGFLAGLSGVANVVQGFMGAVDALKRAHQEGATPSNLMEALSYATQALGGVAQTLALACPPLAAALEPISIGLYMASGALTLAQFAYDHREDIQRMMARAGQEISDGLTRLQAIAESAPTT